VEFIEAPEMVFLLVAPEKGHMDSVDGVLMNELGK
jgi:hypothetical protein